MKERLATRALMSAVALVLLAPLPARARTAEGWRIDFIPPYFWATSLRGDLAAGPPTLPIDLDFDQAAGTPGGRVLVPPGSQPRPWGTLVDLNFISLATDAEFAVAGRPVTGNLELDNVMFEAAAAYLASEPAQLAIIGGLRTYTLSPKIGLTTAGGGVTPVAGLGVRFKPWLALAFGCKGLGIDVDATLLLTYAGDGGEASSSRASGPSRARTRRCYS